MSWVEIGIITCCVLFCIGFIGVALNEMGRQQGPTREEMMGWDFRSCEQMRESGWNEDEIKYFMDKNLAYYDKDYEDEEMINMTKKQYDKMKNERLYFVSSYKGELVYSNALLGIEVEVASSEGYYRTQFSPEMSVYDFELEDLKIQSK